MDIAAKSFLAATCQVFRAEIRQGAVILCYVTLMSACELRR